MVASAKSTELARALPNAELVLYPDSGHGGIFQYHQQFVSTALEFLERPQSVDGRTFR
jgi:pimeloyl-ACP methyl ester carboxylesterase